MKHPENSFAVGICEFSAPSLDLVLAWPRASQRMGFHEENVNGLINAKLKSQPPTTENPVLR